MDPHRKEERHCGESSNASIFLLALGCCSCPDCQAPRTIPPGQRPIRDGVVTLLARTLDDAIQRGLQFNLGLLESQTASQTARADRIQALSSLLPQVTGTLAETDEQLNLRTVGINVPPNPYLTIPTIVGPFSLHCRPGQRVREGARFQCEKEFQVSQGGRSRRRNFPLRTRAIWLCRQRPMHTCWLSRMPPACRRSRRR